MITKAEKETIVVPWSFSNRSETALDWALNISDELSVIRVVHVAAPLSGPDNGILFEKAQMQKVNELESRFRKHIAGDDKAKNIKFHVSFGNVSQEIARFSKRFDAGLIVMATRKKKSISKLFFLYRVERVVRLASCPVLVLQGRKKTKINNRALWRSFGSRQALQNATCVNEN